MKHLITAAESHDEAATKAIFDKLGHEVMKCLIALLEESIEQQNLAGAPDPSG